MLYLRVPGINSMNQSIKDHMISITKDFLKEVHHDARPPHVELTTQLEQELGIDSLGRVELMHRMEQAFQIIISDTQMLRIETLQQLYDVIVSANPKSVPYTILPNHAAIKPIS